MAKTVEMSVSRVCPDTEEPMTVTATVTLDDVTEGGAIRLQAYSEVLDTWVLVLATYNDSLGIAVRSDPLGLQLYTPVLGENVITWTARFKAKERIRVRETAVPEVISDEQTIKVDCEMAPVLDTSTESNPSATTFAELVPGADTFTESGSPSGSWTESSPVADSFSETVPGTDTSTESNPGADSFSESAPGADSTTESSPAADTTAESSPVSDVTTESNPSSDTTTEEQ